MEMEAASKEAEPPHMEGGVWVWLPDRGVCVSPYYAAKYREKNPLPESLQPSPRKGPMRGLDSPASFAFRGGGTQADGEPRSLSE